MSDFVSTIQFYDDPDDLLFIKFDIVIVNNKYVLFSKWAEFYIVINNFLPPVCIIFLHIPELDESHDKLDEIPILWGTVN